MWYKTLNSSSDYKQKNEIDTYTVEFDDIALSLIKICMDHGIRLMNGIFDVKRKKDAG